MTGVAETGFTPGESVTIEVPASSANLGPGFDSIGLALDITDTVQATVGGDGLVVSVAGHGAGTVPTDEEHLIWRSALAMWRRLGIDPPSGLKLHCHNEIPHSRGLGSSAAAIVAGLATALALVRDPIDDAAFLALMSDLAGEIEGHPDNASASVYGGLTVSWADDFGAGWRTVRPRLHPDVRAVVLLPEATLATEQARAALGEAVSLSAAASTAGRAALLVHALTADPGLLLAATRDWLHQEPRRASYPQSMAVVDRLRAAGLAATISGAGPAVLVLVTGDAAVDDGDVPVGWQVLRPGIAQTGVRVVSHSTPSTV
ncbi:homoserine kinase [Flexivirga caeni]|uniref:Homoserine kinase n=1 Tax=Flexivirga caeni TaxID=2294115 RepID=A0A3M9M5S6_9MICO|nr:homoserine kinase [Flexivirga caeni]RNI20911.1 homoserine kinase [Flexivirga caeni]